MTIATNVNTASWIHGIEKRTSNSESARLTSAARKIPSGRPIAAPISAVMMLSCRIIRRTWRRVIPMARSVPISRVRSYTERTSVLIIPKTLMKTARVSIT